jgi:ABC-type sugar transport system permease subunit
MARPRQSLWLWAAALAVYAFLYLPLAVVVIFSFNDSLLNAEWVGFTTRWYGTLFDDTEMLNAAANSLFIAITAASVATVLGTMAGIAMQRWRAGVLRCLPFLVLTPVAMPEILLGVSLLLFFRQVLDLTLGLISILIAHITFSIGFVAIIVRVRLAGMDESIFEAARDLGASPWQTFPARHPALDPAGHPGRFPDELHALDRRLRDHLLCRRRWRHDAAAADLLDDQGGRESRSQCRVYAADGADADLIALASKLAPDTLQGRA